MATTSTIDYSTRDYEGFRQDLIDMLKVKIPEYTDFSSSDAGIVIIELLSYGLDILSYYTDKVANEFYMDSAQERESLIKLSKFIDYTISGATSSEVYQVVEIKPKTTDYTLAKGTQFCTEDSSVIFETEDNATIPANCTGLEKDTNGAYLYKFPLIQGYTIANDIIGTSNNTAYQKFNLSYKSVVQDSIQVYINEGSGFRLWTKIDNFIDSSSTDQVYKAYEDSEGYTVIEFGSGVSGAIPTEYANGIMATYRVGGGTQGNVAASAITKTVSNIADIVSTFNPETPFTVGTDAETNAEIKVNAPASLRVIGDRAVSLSDYKDLMILRGDVLLCKPIAHDDRTTIELFTLMKNDVAVTNDIKTNIIDYFDEKKGIGYDIVVTEATAKSQDLVINIETYPRYVMSTIQTSANNLALQSLTKGNYDIAEEFIPESLVSSILALSGVKKCNITCDTTIGASQYAIAGNITVNVTGGV